MGYMKKNISAQYVNLPKMSSGKLNEENLFASPANPAANISP